MSFTGIKDEFKWAMFSPHLEGLLGLFHGGVCVCVCVVSQVFQEHQVDMSSAAYALSLCLCPVC